MTAPKTHAAARLRRAPFTLPFIPAAVAWASALALVALAAPREAAAQSPAVTTRAALLQIALPAQPLAQTLNALSRQSGVAIGAEGALLAGKSAPALRGALTLQQALDQALAGSGLSAVRSGPSTISIQRRPEGAGQATLPLTTVTADAELDGTTEGSGSYGTRVTGAATRMNLSLRETPQSVSVVSRQQIEDQNLVTLTDVLRQTPGIVADRLDERVSFTSRGFTLSTMIDGIPTLAFNSVAGEPGLVSTAIYDRVEIVRGAAGLLNGVGTPGGSINLVRKRPGTEFAGSVSVGAGSWGRFATEIDLGGKLNEAGTLRGRVMATRNDGKTFTDYKKQKDDVFYGIVEADIAPGTTLAAGYERQATNIKGANFGQTPLFYSDGTRTNLPRSFNSSAPWSTWDMTTERFFVNLEHRFGNGWRLKAEAAQVKNTRERAGGDLWLYPSAVDAATGDAVVDQGYNPAQGTNKSLDVYASGPFELFGRTHQASVGFNVNRYSNWVFGSTSIPDAKDQVSASIHALRGVAQPDFIYPIFKFGSDVEEKAIYAATRLKPTEALSILIGGRLTWYTNNSWNSSYTDGSFGVRVPAAPIRQSRVFTPYAGIVYDVSKAYSVYASYTDIFQPNTLKNSGNNVLSPRRGHNMEVGLKGEHLDGKLNTGFAIFQTQEDNVPVLDENAAQLPDGTQPSRAVKGARSKGYEFTVAGELARGWQLMGGYTYYAKREQSGALIDPNLPRRLLRIATSYRLPGDWNRLTVGGSLGYQSRSTYDEFYGLGRATQGGLTLFGLMARYEFNKQLSASLNIENLGNKRYYAGLGGYNGYTPGTPRNAWLKLNYKF